LWFYSLSLISPSFPPDPTVTVPVALDQSFIRPSTTKSSVPI
jgi:hypothetical protein